MPCWKRVKIKQNKQKKPHLCLYYSKSVNVGSKSD